MKKCFKCLEKKDLSAFYKHPMTADGHLNKCKICTRKDSIDNRNKNIEHYLMYDRMRGSLPHRVLARKNYSKTEAGKNTKAKSNKKWIKNNPEKRAAHIILGNRLREGKVKRKNCEKCGKRKSQAHHEDYSKPLKVKWLCIKCHSFRHKILDLKKSIK